MKNLTLFLITTLTFLFIFSTSASAKIITSENGTVKISETEVVDDDLLVGAQTAEIAGTVNGDVFVGAQTVKITGVINGNLHVGANTIILNGNINGNVYGGAQSIFINGSTIGGSLLVGAATVEIDKESQIGGSVFVGAASLSVDSAIQRNLFAGTGNLTLGDNAKIGKDLYYAVGNEKGGANISKNALISGNVHKSEQKISQKKVKVDVEEVKKKVPAVLNIFRLVTAVISFLGALVVGLIYSSFFSKHFQETADTATQSFWKSFGVGFLISVSLVPGLIMLAFSVIGLPLAGLTLLVFLLFKYLSKLAVSLALGNWLTRQMKVELPLYGRFAFGLAFIYLIEQIPFLGFLVGLVVLWVGLGAIALRTFSKPQTLKTAGAE